MDSVERISRRALTVLVLTVTAMFPVMTGTVASASATAAEPAAPVRAAGADPATDGFTTAMADTLTTTATTNPYLGTALSGLVVDATDGTVVWRHNDTHSRVPASTQKLLTAYTVLTSVPGGTTFATSTCRAPGTPGAPSPVYVHGGGDPSLSAARLQALAASTAAPLRQADVTKVYLYLDASFFPAPTPAPGWTAAYLRSEVQYVRGLTLAGYRGSDGRVAVGKAFVADLKKVGIEATVGGNAVAPPNCAELASTRSAPVGALVASMLARSDNDYAEFLLRHAAGARGFAPSWRGALDNEIDLLTRADVPTGGLRLADGSGLSRVNRMPVATLAAVLRVLYDDAALSGVVFAWNALPTAGRTGTLANRFTTPDQACARGRIQAKTGYLADAVGLAGVAHGDDGRDRVFVLLDNGVKKYTPLRVGIDTLATTVVGCTLVTP
jgi:D-alanyl-D-alanine carboxypeptidase/D-alanyl-D-alanine-endopeptidase (penicillin-binding protein 4)